MTPALDTRGLEEVPVASRDREAYRTSDPDGFRHGEAVLERIQAPLGLSALDMRGSSPG